MNDDNKMILKATFSIDDSYDSDKFIKLNLDLMHDGINRNKSRFFKEGLEKAKNSLFNSPILGHVVENEDGEKDFGSHDSHLEKTEDGVKEIYDEIPIGVVPESAKYEVVHDEVSILELEQRIYVYGDTYVERKVYVPRNELGAEYAHSVTERSVSQLYGVHSLFGSLQVFLYDVLCDRSYGYYLSHLV